MQENDENIDLSLIRKHDSGKGFDVPENYYHDLEEDILQKTVYVGFTTPQGYFETLSQKTEQRIQQQKQARVVPLFTKKYWITGIAASLAAVAGIVFWTMNKNSNNLQADLNAVSDEEIINYAMNANLYDVPVEAIAANVSFDVNEEDIEDILNIEL